MRPFSGLHHVERIAALRPLCATTQVQPIRPLEIIRMMMSADDAFRTASQYLQAGQLAPAEHLYRYVLELQPNHPGALYALGTLAFYASDWTQAIAWMRKATDAQPDRSDYWHDLGVAYHQAGYLSEAIAACEQALEERPDYPLAAKDLGQLYMETGNIEQAISCYEHALRLQPTYADAHTCLASALIEKGHINEALAHYREAVRVQPDFVHAYYNLSQLASEGKYFFSPAEIQQLRALVRNEKLPTLNRSVAAFALGTVLDTQGAYDPAFEAFVQANAFRRIYQRAMKRVFDPEQHRAYVDEVIATFDHEYFSRVQGWGTDTELPVFILGMPRSGTSLVEQILASHPAVYGAGELKEIPRLTDGTPNDSSHTSPRPLAFTRCAMVHEVSAPYLEQLTQLAATKRASRVTNKNLTNVLYLGLLATMFPRARIVYCRRDARDVSLSCFFQNFHYMDFSWSLDDIACYYGQYERLMEHWRSVLPIRIHEVCYEDLIANQEGVSRDLVAHCGLKWDERCLAFHKTRRAIRTASTNQVRKPLSTKSIGRWKHYEAHLGPLLQALSANGVDIDTCIQQLA